MRETVILVNFHTWRDTEAGSVHCEWEAPRFVSVEFKGMVMDNIIRCRNRARKFNGNFYLYHSSHFVRCEAPTLEDWRADLPTDFPFYVFALDYHYARKLDALPHNKNIIELDFRATKIRKADALYKDKWQDCRCMTTVGLRKPARNCWRCDGTGREFVG